MLLKLLSGSSSSGKSVLLIGLPDAGKTVLYSRLSTGSFVRTVTSMKANEAEFNVGKRTYHLVDLPGYDRLRIKYWDDHKKNAKGIVFVVDSLLFLSNIRDVADFLYTVLADPIVQKRRVPILVACNKQDEAKAKSAKVIQNQLEKELNNIRDTRGAALGSTDANSDDVSAKVIGNPDRDFRYSDLNTPIEFTDVYCVEKGDNDGDLENVWSWLKKL